FQRRAYAVCDGAPDSCSASPGPVWQGGSPGMSIDTGSLPPERRSSMLGLHEWITLVIIFTAFLVPVLTKNPQTLSQTNLILIAATAALGVYIMLRMDLMSFAVPAFMAIGGFTVAILGIRQGITEVIIL